MNINDRFFSWNCKILKKLIFDVNMFFLVIDFYFFFLIITYRRDDLSFGRVGCDIDPEVVLVGLLASVLFVLAHCCSCGNAPHALEVAE